MRPGHIEAEGRRQRMTAIQSEIMPSSGSPLMDYV